MCACVRACVGACARARARARVCVCVLLGSFTLKKREKKKRKKKGFTGDRVSLSVFLLLLSLFPSCPPPPPPLLFWCYLKSVPFLFSPNFYRLETAGVLISSTAFQLVTGQNRSSTRKLYEPFLSVSCKQITSITRPKTAFLPGLDIYTVVHADRCFLCLLFISGTSSLLIIIGSLLIF